MGGSTAQQYFQLVYWNTPKAHASTHGVPFPLLHCNQCKSFFGIKQNAINGMITNYCTTSATFFLKLWFFKTSCNFLCRVTHLQLVQAQIVGLSNSWSVNFHNQLYLACVHVPVLWCTLRSILKYFSLLKCFCRSRLLVNKMISIMMINETRKLLTWKCGP